VAKEIFPPRSRYFAATTKGYTASSNASVQIQFSKNHLKLNVKTTIDAAETTYETATANKRSRNLNKRTKTATVAKLGAPDLTMRPPRSPRARLGGYSLLPRALDKGRATLAGTNGEYHFNCPLDQRFLSFVGIHAKKLLAELKRGKGDGEILEWIQANAKYKRSPWEIEQWSDYMDRRGPDSDAETLEFFTDYVAKFTRTREDIKTWADVLELDDFVSFGGKA
jgi:hypothetical protein